MTKTRPIVYISSPYTNGDQGLNTRFQCEVWDQLMTDGLVWPVAPLWSHFQHIILPRKYDDWLDFDLAMIKTYDACLRLNSTFKDLDYLVVESKGADMEVAEFKRMMKPVFYSIEDCYDWVRHI